MKMSLYEFSNINMSSHSLPLVPQWLEMALGVKRALGILLHVEVQSGLQIDMEEPDTSENPTQLFEIHNIIRRSAQLLAVIIYIIL